MGVRRGTAIPSAIYRGTVPVQKIMRGTVEVWSAVITVTPQAPTFLTASPWYTLPTQAGVTYTVSGTPGYSQTVTITATPQAGYALAGQTSWTHTYGPAPLPIVKLTGTRDYDSMNQFRQACIDHGTTYSEVEILPFQLDISQTGIIPGLFYDCSSLMQLPDITTSHVTNMNNMFRNCASLTDGNVRLIGRHPSVSTSYMITGSGLTRLPFYDTNGNPI